MNENMKISAEKCGPAQPKRDMNGYQQYPDAKGMYLKNIGGSLFFNGTLYLEENSDQISKSVSDYWSDRKAFIDTVAAVTKISSPEDLKVVQEGGDWLMSSSLIFDFLNYFNPAYSMMVSQVLSKLEAEGMYVSDKYVIREAMTRFPKEVIAAAFGFNDGSGDGGENLQNGGA